MSPGDPAPSDAEAGVVQIDEGCILEAVYGSPVAELDGETVVLDEEQEVVHALNATATLVWSRCDGSATLGEIISALAESFSTDRQAMHDDVVALAAVLLRRGLLEKVAGDRDC